MSVQCYVGSRKMKNPKPEGIKISDSTPAITEGSRADRYWERKGYNKFFTKVRPGIKLPESLKTNDLADTQKKFNLRGIGFGNWVTIEDRINYLNSLIFAMYDMNKILQFKFNIGCDLLAVTFGARGHSRALAHFEPDTFNINITRYRDGKSPKEIRFFLVLEVWVHFHTNTDTF